MIWIEIRCEYRGEGCLSHSNIGPEGSSNGDTNQDAITCINRLSHDAKRSGWKKLNMCGWVCPVCAAEKKGPTSDN